MIAYLIITSLIALDEGLMTVFWILEIDYWQNLLLGAIGLILMAYIFGRMAGNAIIEKKRITGGLESNMDS